MQISLMSGITHVGPLLDMCVFGGRKLSTNGTKLHLLMKYTFVDQYQKYEVRIVILDCKLQ